MLRDVGMTVEIKYSPATSSSHRRYGRILQLGKFDLAVNGWYAGIDPDDSAQYMCQNVPPGGYNYSRFCNPEMEAAQTAALTHYQRGERVAAYFQTQRVLARSNPEIFFWLRRHMEPISVDFHGFDPNPVVESWNAWQWSI